MPANKQRLCLVCDDEEVVIDAFERAFSGQDEFILDTARSVREALEKLATVQYHVIFLDMKIDHSWSGLQVLREIKRLEVRARSRGQPIVEPLIAIMSGSVMFDSFMEEAETLDVLLFIKKPVDFSPEYVRRKLNQIGIPLLPPATPMLPVPPGAPVMP